MKTRKWIAIMVAGGLVLQLASCASDMAYVAMDAVAEYLPDLLEALLESATSSA